MSLIGFYLILSSSVLIFKQKQPSEDKSLLDDNRKLRDELALLRQELMQAKEEGLKKRISKPQTQPLAQGPIYGDILEKDSEQNSLGFKNNTHIIVFGFMLFIMGIIFGKILI